MEHVDRWTLHRAIEDDRPWAVAIAGALVVVVTLVKWTFGIAITAAVIVGIGYVLRAFFT